MVEINFSEEVWKRCIRDALPVLSAYLSPYLLGNLPVGATGDDQGPFEFAALRFELAKANLARKLLNEAHSQATQGHRLELQYATDAVGGALHVPRFVQEYARGFPRGIPVQRRTSHLYTPENLLVAAVVERIYSLQAFLPSLPKKSSECDEIRGMVEFARDVDSRYPWNEVRHAPRAYLGDLILMVQDRAVAGVIEPEHPAARLAEIYSAEAIKCPEYREELERTFIRLLSHEAKYDKLYELLIVAWIAKWAEGQDTHRVNLASLARGKKGHFVEVTRSEGSVKVFFQRSTPDLSSSYKNKGRPLGGVPDFVVHLYVGEKKYTVIVDPKFRTSAAEAEVVYKMLGYKENFSIKPFHAIAVFPELGFNPYTGKTVRRFLSPFGDSVTLARIPLDGGDQYVSVGMNTMLKVAARNSIPPLLSL